MGEARRRGTFEQRKAAAMKRNDKIISKYKLGAKGKGLSKKQTSILGMMFGLLGSKGVHKTFGGDDDE